MRFGGIVSRHPRRIRQTVTETSPPGDPPVGPPVAAGVKPPVVGAAALDPAVDPPLPDTLAKETPIVVPADPESLAVGV